MTCHQQPPGHAPQSSTASATARANLSSQKRDSCKPLHEFAQP